MKPSKKMGLFMLLIFTVALIQYHLASSWLAGGSNSGTGISYKGQASSEEVLLAAVDKLSLEDSIAASIGQKVFRDLVLQLGRELLASGVCVHASETVTVTQKINKTVIPRIYIITPTYRRPEQIPELTRMAQTLMHVQNIHWLVIEDAENKTQLVTALLRRSGIPHEHLVAPMPEVYKNKKGPKPRGVSNRNKGLEWIRANARNGVVYFADDDNTYDIHLFEEVRTTQRVAMWPVGLCTKFGLSSPVVLNGSFVGFYDGWVGGRKFPVDMAGFAVNVQFLLQRPKASMPYKPGYEEDGFLKSLAPFDPKEIELKAKNCTEILVWHTQTKKKEAATPVDMKKYNATNLALLKDLIV